MIDSLICYISNIPDVIWSAVIASLLTFLGVLWTNKGNERRQNILLKHEKEKYKFEQEIELKKEVFLNIAKSFADVIGIIPKLINLDFSQKEISLLLENHSGIVAKSYLIAKEKTVKEILNYSALSSESFIGLMKDREILLDHKEAMNIYQSVIDKTNEEKNRIISMMQELNFQGSSNQIILTKLNENYDFQEKTIKDFKQKYEEQEEKFIPIYQNFLKKCISEHSKLLSEIVPMTLALRSELDNNENSKIFIDALNENVEKMKTSLNSILE